jgi:hypothetical protein
MVFMAVAGEEQGLFGSTHFAELAKQANVNIDGMFTNDIIGSSLGQNGQRDRFSVRLFAEGTPIVVSSVSSRASIATSRCSGARTPNPTWPAMRSSGATPPSRSGLTPGSSAR